MDKDGDDDDEPRFLQLLSVNLRVLLVRNAVAELTWLYVRVLELLDLSGLSSSGDPALFAVKSYSELTHDYQDVF